MYIIAVDDGYFEFKWRMEKHVFKAPVCFVYTYHVEPLNVVLKLMTIDGLDGTEIFLDTANEILHGRRTLDLVLLAGITYCGFNIIDPVVIHETLNVPVIVVTDKPPNDEAVEKALRAHFRDYEVRLRILQRFRRCTSIVRVEYLNTQLYLQPLGLAVDKAVEYIKSLMLKSGYPEPLRLAKLIASTIGRLIARSITSTC